jgi:ABC-type multidrug transport system ATPase subunit
VVQYIIEARNLTKQFADFVAVDSISFQVLPGECFGLLGPNGAGKTSTIRMTYGFSPITDGHLEVFGRNITSDWRAIRYRIGVCQQENNLDPDLTVQQNLNYLPTISTSWERRLRVQSRKTPALHCPRSSQGRSSDRAVGRHDAATDDRPGADQ